MNLKGVNSAFVSWSFDAAQCFSLLAVILPSSKRADILFWFSLQAPISLQGQYSGIQGELFLLLIVPKVVSFQCLKRIICLFTPQMLIEPRVGHSPNTSERTGEQDGLPACLAPLPHSGVPVTRMLPYTTPASPALCPLHKVLTSFHDPLWTVHPVLIPPPVLSSNNPASGPSFLTFRSHRPMEFLFGSYFSGKSIFMCGRI